MNGLQAVWAAGWLNHRHCPSFITPFAPLRRIRNEVTEKHHWKWRSLFCNLVSYTRPVFEGCFDPSFAQFWLPRRSLPRHFDDFWAMRHCFKGGGIVQGGQSLPLTIMVGRMGCPQSGGIHNLGHFSLRWWPFELLTMGKAWNLVTWNLQSESLDLCTLGESCILRPSGALRPRDFGICNLGGI